MKNCGRTFLFLVLATALLSCCWTSARAAESSRVDDRGDSDRRTAKTNDFGLAEVRLINDAIARAGADHELVPSKAATDGEWCRRVYLDLIGRVPTVEELHDLS